MRFLIDANLPRLLARRLVDDGFTAEHVSDCGLAAAKDRDIWDHALRIGATIIKVARRSSK